jgi:hypothetical protein
MSRLILTLLAIELHRKATSMASFFRSLTFKKVLVIVSCVLNLLGGSGVIPPVFNATAAVSK